MTSLFMGTLVSSGVPADEKTVRNTAVVVNPAAPAAMQSAPPVMGKVETDPNPELGMDPRQMASVWHEGERAPIAWREDVDHVTESFNVINRQVSSSGTAASREADGVTNKNLSYAIGIEPVGDLGNGGRFGNEYFVREPRNVQDTADPSMSVAPGMSDPGLIGSIKEAGNVNARQAAMASLYNQFWNGGQRL